jgi:hypothetical protein
LILLDRQNNALLIQGTEAHIFETIDKISWKLGLHWRGTGIYYSLLMGYMPWKLQTLA